MFIECALSFAAGAGTTLLIHRVLSNRQAQQKSKIQILLQTFEYVTPVNVTRDNSKVSRVFNVLDFGNRILLAHGVENEHYRDEFMIIIDGIQIPATYKEERLIKKLFRQKMFELAEMKLTNRLLEMSK